jgi:hypothetical protein
MRLIPSCAVSGATIDHGEPCRGRHQAGASLLCALPIVRRLQPGQETGSEPNLSESLRNVGVEPQRALELAKTAEARAV